MKTNRTLTYDRDGNLTDDGNGNTYTFDAANRMISATNSTTGTVQFAYDGFGRRVQEKDGNGNILKQWVWLTGDAQPSEERNASNTVTKRFYALGEQINGTSYFATKDHLGSVREMTDSAGNLVARYDYDAWGRRTLVSGTDLADFGFTGFYHDQATGLDFSRTRPYTAELARWLGRDPIGEAGGINLYAYTGNNPINYTDPSGKLFGGDDAIEGDAYLVGLAVLAGYSAYEAVQMQHQSEISLQDFYIRLHARKEAAEAAKPAAGKCPTQEEVKGKTKEEIDKEMKEKGWVAAPTREGEGSGTRYANPDKPGEQVRVMPGKATDPNPVKQGPYVRISTGGKVSPPIPIAGNPASPP